MFEKSRRRIIAAIMSVLVLLFLGTLAVIYISSYYEVARENYRMLERHVESYYMNPPDKAFIPDMEAPMYKGEGMPYGDPERYRREESPAFHLSTFYTVAISAEGDVMAVDNGNGEVYDEATLSACALEVVKSGRHQGIKGSLVYHVDRQGGYYLVAFMDNTIMQESMTTLFRYTLVFGSIAMAGLYFIAVQLAKRIVQPLEESYQKQKQFISDAGHELKTPVSVVSANAELLSREIGSNQWLSNIQYENERMGQLVGQLLELARTENVEPVLEHLDLSRLAAGETLAFESVAFEHGIALNAQIADGLHIEGEELKLRQLVAILIDNAIRHSTGKEIRLDLKEERSHIFLSVINQGEEIPPEQQKQLFERFYRSDAARSSADGHYGLGLAIAKAIVIAHKGKIDVRCYDGLVEFVVIIPKIRQK